PGRGGGRAATGLRRPSGASAENGSRKPRTRKASPWATNPSPLRGYATVSTTLLGLCQIVRGVCRPAPAVDGVGGDHQAGDIADVRRSAEPAVGADRDEEVVGGT